jgi:hypothetical protein
MSGTFVVVVVWGEGGPGVVCASDEKGLAATTIETLRQCTG